MDLISVIIPVYNVEKYLVKCLNSVLNQSYNLIEVILINDGSTDKSLSICEEYRQKDKRIHILSQINKGPSEARNAGIKIAKGLYFIFIDSDDTIPKEFIEKLYKVLKKGNCLMAVADVKYIYTNGSVHKNFNLKDDIEIVGKERIMESLIPKKGGISNYACNKIYHRSLFNNIQFEGRKFEDVRTMYKILYNVEKLICTSKTEYHYYIRDSGITGLYKGDFLNFDFIDANFEKYIFISDHFPNLSQLSFHQLANSFIFYFNSGIHSNNYNSDQFNDISKTINYYAKKEKYWKLSFCNYMKIIVIYHCKALYRYFYKLYKNIQSSKDYQ